MQSEIPTPLNIRLTSWEKWGFRIATPFTREGLEHLKQRVDAPAQVGLRPVLDLVVPVAPPDGA